MRRRKMLLAVWAIFAALVALATVVQPKKYTTQCEDDRGQREAPGASQNAQTDAGTNLPILNALLAANGVQSSETYAELIQQTPVAQEVARQVGLNVGAAELLSHLQVKPVTDTAILALNVTWKDPVMSAKIAERFRERVRRSRAGTRRPSGRLRDRLLTARVARRRTPDARCARSALGVSGEDRYRRSADADAE